MNPNIHLKCEPYTPECEEFRRNLSPEELCDYPLYSPKLDTITGHCETGTIKEYIEYNIWYSTLNEMKEFIDLTISRRITIFPYVFHGHISCNPRADHGWHPIFQGFFKEDSDNIVFDTVCYIREKTDYHQFPQPIK